MLVGDDGTVRLSDFGIARPPGDSERPEDLSWGHADYARTLALPNGRIGRVVDCPKAVAAANVAALDMHSVGRTTLFVAGVHPCTRPDYMVELPPDAPPCEAERAALAAVDWQDVAATQLQEHDPELAHLAMGLLADDRDQRLSASAAMQHPALKDSLMPAWDKILQEHALWQTTWPAISTAAHQLFDMLFPMLEEARLLQQGPTVDAAGSGGPSTPPTGISTDSADTPCINDAPGPAGAGNASSSVDGSLPARQQVEGVVGADAAPTMQSDCSQAVKRRLGAVRMGKLLLRGLMWGTKLVYGGGGCGHTRPSIIC